MSETWYEHTCFCETENAWVNKITKTETELTSCPNNSLHVIKSGSGSILSSVSTNEVRVIQESGGSTNGGHYTAHGRTFTATGSTQNEIDTKMYKTTTDIFDLEMPFSVLTGVFQSRSGMDRDVLNLRLIPKGEQTIGVLTQEAVQGATVLHVASPVLHLAGAYGSVVYLRNANGECSERHHVESVGNGEIVLKTAFRIGDESHLFPSGTTSVVLLSNILGVIPMNVTTNSQWITVTSSVFQEFRRARWINLFRSSTSKSDIRMINDIDEANSRVHIQSPFDIGMNTADGTIYVQLCIKPLVNVTLKDTTTFILGGSVIGGSFQPKNVGIMAEYTRRQLTDIEVDYMFEMFA